MTTLEEVLEVWDAEAKVLRKHGDSARADAITQMAYAVRRSASDYLTFLTEGEAKIYSDKSLRWLRAQFPVWERDGHARTVNGRKLFRQVVLPRRANPRAAYEAGRLAAATEAA